MKYLKPVVLAAGFMIVLVTPAHAYIDPGTGTIIVQAIVGSLVAATLFWRQLREKVVSFFRNWTGSKARRRE